MWVLSRLCNSSNTFSLFFCLRRARTDPKPRHRFRPQEYDTPVSAVVWDPMVGGQSGTRSPGGTGSLEGFPTYPYSGIRGGD